CYRNGFGYRARHAPAAQSLQGDNEINRVRLEAVEPLRHRQRGDPQVGQLRPDLATGSGVATGPGAHSARNIGRRERRVDTGGEIALLRVKVESHLLFSRGSPSSRSAMMFR